MADIDKCPECGAIHGAHYSRCSHVSPAMRQILADIASQDLDRQRRELECDARREVSAAKMTREAMNEVAADSMLSSVWRVLIEQETAENLYRLRRLLR